MVHVMMLPKAFCKMQILMSSGCLQNAETAVVSANSLRSSEDIQKQKLKTNSKISKQKHIKNIR